MNIFLEEKQLKNETDTKDKEIQILKNELQQAEYRITQGNLLSEK